MVLFRWQIQINTQESLSMGILNSVGLESNSQIKLVRYLAFSKPIIPLCPVSTKMTKTFSRSFTRPSASISNMIMRMSWPMNPSWLPSWKRTPWLPNLPCHSFSAGWTWIPWGQLGRITQELRKAFYSIKKPEFMLFDIDSTLLDTYGNQKGEGFNSHYRAHGYHPLLYYDGLDW